MSLESSWQMYITEKTMHLDFLHQTASFMSVFHELFEVAYVLNKSLNLSVLSSSVNEDNTSASWPCAEVDRS